MIERPEGIEDIHLEYLDKLRMSGAVNVLCTVVTRAHLARKFGLDSRIATRVLQYWLDLGEFDEKDYLKED